MRGDVVLERVSELGPPAESFREASVGFPVCMKVGLARMWQWRSRGHVVALGDDSRRPGMRKERVSAKDMETTLRRSSMGQREIPIFSKIEDRVSPSSNFVEIF